MGTIFFVNYNGQFVNFVGRIRTNENYLQIARNENKLQKTIPDDVPFPCNITGKPEKNITILHFYINNYVHIYFVAS